MPTYLCSIPPRGSLGQSQRRRAPARPRRTRPPRPSRGQPELPDARDLSAASRGELDQADHQRDADGVVEPRFDLEVCRTVAGTPRRRAPRRSRPGRSGRAPLRAGAPRPREPRNSPCAASATKRGGQRTCRRSEREVGGGRPRGTPSARSWRPPSKRISDEGELDDAAGRLRRRGSTDTTSSSARTSAAATEEHRDRRDPEPAARARRRSRGRARRRRAEWRTRG